MIKTMDECFHKALYYIGGGLNCLQYFKNDKDTTVSNIPAIFFNYLTILNFKFYIDKG